MSFSVILLSRAKHELLDAWEWYEDKQPGLGDRFIEETYKTIQHIQKHPEHYQQRKRLYREALTDIFPYLIIYRVLKKEETIVVSSIYHTSRNPRKKYK